MIYFWIFSIVIGALLSAALWEFHSLLPMPWVCLVGGIAARSAAVKGQHLRRDRLVENQMNNGGEGWWLVATLVTLIVAATAAIIWLSPFLSESASKVILSIGNTSGKEASGIVLASAGVITSIAIAYYLSVLHGTQARLKELESDLEKKILETKKIQNRASIELNLATKLILHPSARVIKFRVLIRAALSNPGLTEPQKQQLGDLKSVIVTELLIQEFLVKEIDSVCVNDLKKLETRLINTPNEGRKMVDFELIGGAIRQLTLLAAESDDSRIRKRAPEIRDLLKSFHT